MLLGETFDIEDLVTYMGFNQVKIEPHLDLQGPSRAWEHPCGEGFQVQLSYIARIPETYAEPSSCWVSQTSQLTVTTTP